MRAKKQKLLLTEVELEFMTVLWELQEASVRDILENLAAERKLAYTSAATIMRILEQKNFIRSVKRGKTLFYQAILEKETYQQRSLNDIAAKLFDNTPVSMVARLIDSENISEEKLREIRKLLDEKIKS